MIASGQAEGIQGDTYYGYRPDLKYDVEAAFSRFGLPLADNTVQLIEGRYEDTLWPTEPVAFAHIDCSCAESTSVRSWCPEVLS
jgi:asparagine synthase (glutamine-hydrolysing)